MRESGFSASEIGRHSECPSLQLEVGSDYPVKGLSTVDEILVEDVCQPSAYRHKTSLGWRAISEGGSSENPHNQ